MAPTFYNPIIYFTANEMLLKGRSYFVSRVLWAWLMWPCDHRLRNIGLERTGDAGYG
jgi:hypothetical protein